MTALAAGRDTPKRNGHERSLPVAANKSCYIGGIAVVAGTPGRVQPGTAATNLKAVGVFKETLIGAPQDTPIKVEREGWFRFGNSTSSDAIAIKDIGADCYVVDDNTVALTDGSSSRSVAGTIRDVDSLGVWISFKN